MLANLVRNLIFTDNVTIFIQAWTSMEERRNLYSLTEKYTFIGLPDKSQLEWISFSAVTSVKN